LILFLKIKIKRSQPAAAPTVKTVKGIFIVRVFQRLSYHELFNFP
jgi:hypothetical protein